MYFANKFNKINKKYDIKYIYKNWKLNTNDQRLMKWIQIIDPIFYKKIKKYHLKYQK